MTGKEIEAATRPAAQGYRTDRPAASGASYTPGPWKLTQESVDPAWHIITANGGRIIANVHVEPGNAMDLANAHMVVAAPEMLSALKALVTILDEQADELSDANIAYLPEIESARAALASAEPK